MPALHCTIYFTFSLAHISSNKFYPCKAEKNLFDHMKPPIKFSCNYVTSHNYGSSEALGSEYRISFTQDSYYYYYYYDGSIYIQLIPRTFLAKRRRRENTLGTTLYLP